MDEKLLNLANDVSLVSACPIPCEAPPRARVIVVVISDYERDRGQGTGGLICTIAPARLVWLMSNVSDPAIVAKLHCDRN